MVKKPTQPPTLWSFPKHGPPSVVQYDLPAEFEKLELHIVERFSEFLRDRGHSVSARSRPAGTRPDGEIAVDGRVIGIELVEVVDSAHRRLMAEQTWYSTEIIRRIGDDAFGRCRGLVLLISDNWAGLPKRGSKSGDELIAACASLAKDFLRIDIGPPNQGWSIESGTVQAQVIALPGSSNLPLKINWTGGFMVNRTLLNSTLAKKYAQGYAPGDSSDAIWLVAWDSAGYLMGQSAPEVATLLPPSHASEFEQVWAMSVLPDSVMADRIHPRLQVSGVLQFEGANDSEAIVLPAYMLRGGL